MATTTAGKSIVLGDPTPWFGAPLIGALYGPRYLPMARVFQVMAIFTIPRLVILPAYNLLLATENQKPLVIWNCVCGVVDILLDLTLIPFFAAFGAAAANGIAQTLAAGRAVFLVNHGIVTVGADVREATVAAVLLEMASQQQLLTAGFGGWPSWSDAEESMSKRQNIYGNGAVLAVWDYLSRTLAGAGAPSRAHES